MAGTLDLLDEEVQPLGRAVRGAGAPRQEHSPRRLHLDVCDRRGAVSQPAAPPARAPHRRDSHPHHMVAAAGIGMDDTEAAPTGSPHPIARKTRPVEHPTPAVSETNLGTDDHSVAVPSNNRKGRRGANNGLVQIPHSYNRWRRIPLRSARRHTGGLGEAAYGVYGENGPHAYQYDPSSHHDYQIRIATIGDSEDYRRWCSPY